MDDLYSLTVVELKERLKEKGLPVSGKKAELIARLKGNSGISFVLGEKYEIECSACPTTLRVPCDYSGNITCPQCNAKSEVTPQWGEGDEFESNLSGLIAEVPMEGTPNSLTMNTYDFVTGPDGQRFAIKKSTFSWMDWSVGFFGTIACYIVLWIVGIDSAGSGLCCGVMFFAPPSIIGGFGATSGKSGIGIGAMTALVVVPLIFIVGCFVVIMSYSSGI